jgi:hypothetical protein
LTSKYPNSVLLFRNEKRAKDTDAHYTGNGEVGGVDYWVDGWINTPEGKKPYMKLAFKEKVARPNAPAKEFSLAQELDDDIPF